MEGTSYLCKTDEVGEICVNSGSTARQYWGLQGLTNNTFKVQPLQADGTPLGDAEYTRSGLLGFLGPVCSFYFHLSFCSAKPQLYSAWHYLLNWEPRVKKFVITISAWGLLKASFSNHFRVLNGRVGGEYLHWIPIVGSCSAFLFTFPFLSLITFGSYRVAWCSCAGHETDWWPWRGGNITRTTSSRRCWRWSLWGSSTVAASQSSVSVSFVTSGYALSLSSAPSAVRKRLTPILFYFRNIGIFILCASLLNQSVC